MGPLCSLLSALCSLFSLSLSLCALSLCSLSLCALSLPLSLSGDLCSASTCVQNFAFLFNICNASILCVVLSIKNNVILLCLRNNLMYNFNSQVLNHGILQGTMRAQDQRFKTWPDSTLSPGSRQKMDRLWTISRRLVIHKWFINCRQNPE